MIMGVRLSTHFIIFPVISTPDDFDITDPVLPGTYHRPYSSYKVLQADWRYKLFSILGGFYQDSLAQKEIILLGTGCKACPPGTYVDPSRAPGKAQSDCTACPKGNDFALFKSLS